MLLALSVGAIFAACANAMSGELTASAPFIQYRQSIHETAKVFKLDRTISYTMLRRTSDDRARWTLDSGATGIFRSSKLIPPAFDAISDFELHGREAPSGYIEIWTENIRPITFSKDPSSGAVGFALKGYVLELASDSTDKIAHIHFTPTPDNVRISPRLFFKDVWCDRSTNLLARAEFVGPEERIFNVDYIVDHYRLVVSHVFLAQTYSRALGIVRARLSLEARYSDFLFPTELPEGTFGDGGVSPAKPLRK